MPPVSVELKKQVKAANDIVDVVAAYLLVHPAGKTFKVLCPFHSDTRPSLQLDRTYQNFRCWACDARGDVFDFVMKFEKVDFPEALRILAARAGIKLDPATEDPQARTRARLLEAVRWAEEKYQGFFLNDPAAGPARTYLGERKLSGKTAQQFGLGYAPVGGDWLVRQAAAEGIATDVLVEVGLIAARDEGRGHYDRFRDRVMFPIRDVRGRTVGFGGRILPSSPLASRGPKYYNSADTPLFNKSDLLYGLDRARHAGASTGCLAVVEGYTDVLMAHQCGVENVVATMGTALTHNNVLQLRRYAPKVVLVFDSDDAGAAAADKALELFWVQHDVEIAVTTLPDGLDPCDLMQQPGGAERFRECLQSAKSVLDYKLDSILERTPDRSLESVQRIVDSVLAVMALAPQGALSASAQVRQELMVTRLAHRLGLRQETIWARLGEMRATRRHSGPAVRKPEAAEPGEPQAGPAVRAERQLLELLLAEPALVAVAATELPADRLAHSGLRGMLTELYALQESGQTPDMDALRVRLLLQDRPDLVEAAQRLQFVGQHTQDRPEYLRRVLNWFEGQRIEAEKQTLKEQLAAGADEEQQIELLRQMMARTTAAVSRP